MTTQQTAARSYRDSDAYRRSTRFDADGLPVWPLRTGAEMRAAGRR